MKNSIKTKLLQVKPWLPAVVLLPVVLAQVGSGRQVTGDAPHLLGAAMLLGAQLGELSLSGFFSDWLTLVAPHPPGAYLLPAVLYAVVGPADYVPLLASGVCLAITWDAVLRMLRATGAGGQWGVALFLAAAPLVWREAELFGLDLLAAAFVAQCLSRLMASRGLSLRREAALAGLWLGLGFWTKYTFPMFLVIPCGAVVAGLVWDRLRGRKVGAQVVNGLWLVLAMVLAAGPLFLARGRGILGYVFRSLAPSAEEAVSMGGYLSGNDAGTSSVDRHLRYLGSLKDLWGWPGLVLIVAGLVLLVVWMVGAWRRGKEADTTRHQLRAAALCVCCAVGGFLVLSTIVIKLDRYMLPLLTPLLVVAVPPLWRRRFVPLLVVGALAPALVMVTLDYSGLTHASPMDGGLAGVEVHGGIEAPGHRTLDHSAGDTLTSWGRYPLVEERFRPISRSFGAWGLERALQRVAAHLPAGGSLGYLVQEEMRSPSFGVLLMTMARKGHRWNIVTLRLQHDSTRPGRIQQTAFVGPFFRGQPPSFTALLSIHGPGWLLARQFVKERRLRKVHQHVHAGDVVRAYIMEAGKPR